MNTSVKYIAEIAMKATMNLVKRVRNLHVPLDCLIETFDKITILFYGSEVCGVHYTETIESVHLHFLKRAARSNGPRQISWYMANSGEKRAQ